ncbi:MAG: hypothetical protein AAGM38_09740 [Pseudomonadota bacterium]
MSGATPDLEDYASLFERYGADLGALYQEPEDDRYAFLFEQVARLLIRPSRFNLALPEPFRRAASLYLAGDAKAVAHLSRPANRHFMLCDLHDLIMLKGGLALRRGAAKRQAAAI